jgi:hypothetical protein
MAPEWDRKEPAAIQVAGFQVISENDGANLPHLPAVKPKRSPPRCLQPCAQSGRASAEDGRVLIHPIAAKKATREAPAPAARRHLAGSARGALE